MTPYKNRLLVEFEESKSVLVSSENKYERVGKVMAVGWRPWYMFWMPRFAKVGDRVMVQVWGVDFISYNDKEYAFVLENPDFLLSRLPKENVVE